MVLSTTAATGFNSIGLATAERRLDFRIITIVQLFGQIVLADGTCLLVAIRVGSAVANVISSVATVAIGSCLRTDTVLPLISSSVAWSIRSLDHAFDNGNI